MSEMKARLSAPSLAERSKSALNFCKFKDKKEKAAMKIARAPPAGGSTFSLSTPHHPTVFPGLEGSSHRHTRKHTHTTVSVSASEVKTCDVCSRVERSSSGAAPAVSSPTADWSMLGNVFQLPPPRLGGGGGWRWGGGVVKNKRREQSGPLSVQSHVNTHHTVDGGVTAAWRNLRVC